MKTLLISFFALVASSASCLADNISVTLGTDTPCTFSASSMSDGFVNPNVIGSATGGAGATKITFSPVVLVKALDSCSIPLTLQLLRVAAVPTVTITISDGKKPVLVIALTGAYVSSIVDSDSNQDTFTEKVTLLYQSIIIRDLVDNTSTTCDAVSNVCS